ncbi:extracellular solute-binding protein [Paenibacillus sp. MWE-103]|uniref:Extracellular solute-binding protein n=1 Tax=Paenibacillus artemisiicola TaxID=1172618 RepID=A0ABS3WKY2_9BACL|nr:extracellular solute-binding protein [Paenibacillus artemisiicola]MBO7749001.1 extracellular solute-binding protein [Paenibacillus artemisiicola]
MKRIGKSAVVLLAVSLLLGLLAACSGNGGNAGNGNNGTDGAGTANGGTGANAGNDGAAAGSGELATIKIVQPGSEPTEAKKRWDAVNAKLKADGAGVQVEFQYIGWDAWEQKTNLMLSTNEPFDDLTIMEDLIKTSVYVGRGALQPIDAYLAKYPDLKNKFTDEVWNGIKVNGKIYGIPVINREWANDYELISYRSDLFAKYNLPVPTTFQGFIDAADQIKKAEKDQNLFVVMKPNFLAGALHREYGTYPFNVIDDLIYVDQSGNVKSWMETDEFKQDWSYFHQMYQKGLIHPDILTLPLDQVTKPIVDGEFIFDLGNGFFDYPTIKQKKPEVEMDAVRLAPEKQWMRPIVATNANVIPKTSKNPEAVIKFYNWLYSSQDNYDLLVYGIKDDWWKDAGPNKREALRPVGNEVQFSEWTMGYGPFTRIATNAHPKLFDTLQLSDKAVNAANVGFTFDTTPVSVEYANLLAEIKTSVYPLKMGVADWDDFYPGALKKMKAAGLDKVVAEYKKQFDAWKASK